jgi:type II secretory pathway component PulM
MKTLIVITAILIATSWGALAIYYGDSYRSLLQTVLAIGFGFSGLLTIFTLRLPPFNRRILVLFGMLFVCILLWWLCIQPLNDRQWQQNVEKLANATVKGDFVTIRNIRNFDYKSEFN